MHEKRVIQENKTKSSTRMSASVHIFILAGLCVSVGATLTAVYRLKTPIPSVTQHMTLKRQQPPVVLLTQASHQHQTGLFLTSPCIESAAERDRLTQQLQSLRGPSAKWIASTCHQWQIGPFTDNHSRARWHNILTQLMGKSPRDKIEHSS